MNTMKLTAISAALTLCAGMASAEQQCWVGAKYNDSSQWNIACTQTYGTGSQILAQGGVCEHFVWPSYMGCLQSMGRPAFCQGLTREYPTGAAPWCGAISL